MMQMCKSIKRLSSYFNASRSILFSIFGLSISRFNNVGIVHYDLFFIDGSCPPRTILFKFLQISEEADCAIAVHCKVTNLLYWLFNFQKSIFDFWQRNCSGRFRAHGLVDWMLPHQALQNDIPWSNWVDENM